MYIDKPTTPTQKKILAKSGAIQWGVVAERLERRTLNRENSGSIPLVAFRSFGGKLVHTTFTPRMNM